MNTMDLEKIRNDFKSMIDKYYSAQMDMTDSEVMLRSEVSNIITSMGMEIFEDKNRDFMDNLAKLAHYINFYDFYGDFYGSDAWNDILTKSGVENDVISFHRYKVLRLCGTRDVRDFPVLLINCSPKEVEGVIKDDRAKNYYHIVETIAKSIKNAAGKDYVFLISHSHFSDPTEVVFNGETYFFNYDGKMRTFTSFKDLLDYLFYSSSNSMISVIDLDQQRINANSLRINKS